MANYGSSVFLCEFQKGRRRSLSRKTEKFNQTGASKLSDAKPVIYKIQTDSGKTNYVGIAKRERVQERIKEHLEAGKIPGAKVQIEQVSSIGEAQKKEQNIISRVHPESNTHGK